MAQEAEPMKHRNDGLSGLRGRVELGVAKVVRICGAGYWRGGSDAEEILQGCRTTHKFLVEC